MKGTVAVLGTFDTKGKEYAFLIEQIKRAGAGVLTIDAGVLGEPWFRPDIARDEVAEAGGASIAEIAAKKDRGHAVSVMTAGAPVVLKRLAEEGRIHAVISLGGTAGTTIGTAAMRALPVGFPKLMVSTVASGDTRPYVGETDITMMNSVTDISGINSISAVILSNAAGAAAGMANLERDKAAKGKPVIVATMFGVTTPCVTTAKDFLESIGYEVLVFHATGSGGRSMEGLVRAGLIDGVLDITTTEWCDELVGGVFNAGPERLDAAALCGVPQVVSLGALDMVNFGPPETVPDKFKGRKFYQHNATVTLMRTTAEECAELGKIIGEKLSRSKGPCTLFIPLRGVSMIDAEGKPFHGAEEDAALFAALREHTDASAVKIVELDMHINDEEYALAMAKCLDEAIKSGKE